MRPTQVQCGNLKPALHMHAEQTTAVKLYKYFYHCGKIREIFCVVKPLHTDFPVWKCVLLEEFTELNLLLLIFAADEL